MQLRDEETHKPLKGITVGEIGTKVGFNSVNNGFLGFDNVRIPLDNMLMKNAKVSPSGEFVKEKSSLLAYGTMTYIRVGIVDEAARFMACAATIAMRYATVRRQSPIDPNQSEPRIIEHVTQQMKIFPVIAKAVVFKKIGDSLIEMYHEVMKDLQKSDLSRLSELHALSCCLKAVCSTEAVEGIQICRLACGGHGYLSSAGFSDLFKSTTAAQTYEGENTVLLLQTARFLMKSWEQALRGEKLTPTVAYMSNYVIRGNISVLWDGSPDGIFRALQTATAGMIARAYKHFEERKKRQSPEEAANLTGIEFAKAAEMHCQLFLLQSTIKTINMSILTVSPALAFVFRDVLELYSVDLALKSLGTLMQVRKESFSFNFSLNFFSFQFVEITSKDLEVLQVRLERCLMRMRHNAIGLVDGFDFPDTVLGSTLGAYDGNVYERLLDTAKKSPLNQEDVNKSFHLYLKPLMQSNL